MSNHNRDPPAPRSVRHPARRTGVNPTDSLEYFERAPSRKPPTAESPPHDRPA